MTIASVLLQTICPALLPPADAVDFEYYAVLGLEKPKNILNPWAHLPNNGKGHSSDKNEKSKSNSKSSPTVTEIRKAYKLVSLQWHPDKVAQRKDGNATHAAALYERVQEAAAVLTDDVQRQLYHDYHCSVARYRFVSSNAASGSSWPLHSSAVWDNLAAASWTDKTRLLLLTTTLILLFLLQPILVATKINHEHQSTNDSSSSDQHQPALLSTVPWTILLIPTWMAGALYVVGTGLVAWVWVPRAWRATSHEAVALLTSEAPLLAALAWWRSVAVGIGLILLARAWDQNDHRSTAGGHDNDDNDNNDNDTNWWTTLAAPCYVVLALSLGRQVHQVQIWRRAMGLMHSVEYIQQTEGISASDWSLVYQPDHDDNDENDDENDEEQQQDATTTDHKAQRKKVAATYIVVHANPALVAQILEAIRTETNETVDPMSNDMEAIRVQSSLEFQTLDRALQATFRSMGILALIWIPLATLIVLKVNGTLDSSTASWWVVFCPLWIRLGLPWIRHFLICCCSGGSELEEQDDDDHDDKEETTKDENETKKDEIETKKDAMEQADKAPSANASGNANTDTNFCEDATSNEPSPLRQLHRQSDVPDDEALWASPEGDISEFNAASPQATTLHSSSSATDATGGGAAPSGSTLQPNGQDEKAAAKPQSNISGGDDDDDDETNEDFEEMFRQYQQHLHQDDENERMQEKLNALSSCCLLSFQLLLLCLVVAKLEHDSDGDTTAFNAFWVLFPILVLAGLVLLCCSACIYAKNPPTDPAAAPSTPEVSSSVAPPATETPTVVAPTTGALSPIDASTMTTTTPIAVAPTLVPDTTSETHALDAASVDPTTGNNTVGSPATTTPNADAVTGGGTLEDLD
jgi:DnaJ domain